MNKTLWSRIVSHFDSLCRDRENGLLLGVAAGIAARYGLNLLGVRVVAVAALLSFPLPTALVYLALGLTLPEARLSYFGRVQERRFWRAGGDDYGVGQ